jgi:hypothetical protein
LDPKEVEPVGRWWWSQGFLSAWIVKTDQALGWIPAHAPVHFLDRPLDAETRGIGIDSCPGGHLDVAPWHVPVEHVHCKYDPKMKSEYKLGQKVALFPPSLLTNNQKKSSTFKA